MTTKFLIYTLILATTAAASTPLSWEIAGNYNHAFRSIRTHAPAPSIDTWGADITGLYHLHGHHHLTFRFSYAYGADDGFRMHNFAIMPGYRYMRPLNEQWCIFAGVNAGIGVSMLDYPGMERHTYALSNRDDMANLVYSAELGARYTVSPHVRVIGSIGLNGGTSPFHSARYEDAREEQFNLGVRLGIHYQF